MNLDIPTALTERESKALEKLAYGQNVLEAGALLGYSTVLMALVANHVVSVDPHFGYPENDPKPTLSIFMRNIERYGVSSKVTPIVGTLNMALNFLDPLMFSLIFLDLTGRYEDTYEAMYLTKSTLAHGGIIAVHDCGHPEWPGVEQAVKTFAKLEKIDPVIIDRLAIFGLTVSSETATIFS